MDGEKVPTQRDPLTINRLPSIKTILLVTPLDLSVNGAGQIYLDSLIKGTKSAHFVPLRLPRMENLTYAPKSNIFIRATTSLLARFALWQNITLSLYTRSTVLKDVEQVRIAAASNADCTVWITLSSLKSVLLAYELVQAGVQVRVTIWDELNYLLRSQSIGDSLATQLRQAYTRVLRKARTVSVIGSGMRDLYQRTLGVESIIIRPASIVIPPPPLVRKGHKSLRLVFAGSLYAKGEWNSLVLALDKAGWQINYRPVYIYFLGRFPLRGAITRRNVAQLGYRTPDEARSIIEKCDIGYLPYWFSERYADVARTSFPSKLSTYVSCGVSILNHGPDYTEATQLMSGKLFGASCHSLDSTTIIEALTQLERTCRTDECQAALLDLSSSVLSPEVMLSRFAEFLELESLRDVEIEEA